MVKLTSNISKAPLNFAKFETDNYQLNELPLSGKINLRGKLENNAFIETVEAILGIALPQKMNTLTSAHDKQLMMLAPDEYLFLTKLDTVPEILQALQKALDKMPAAVTDVSDYYTVLRLQGDKAREILATGSPFDFRLANFSQGQCVQTRFAQASILLWQTDDKPSFDIQIRWSYAQYLFDYLSQSIQNIEALTLHSDEFQP